MGYLLGYAGPRDWNGETVIVFAMIYGVWGGIFTSVGNVVVAQLFGRSHLGSISGLWKSFSLVAGALGPEFMGIVRDITGSYDLALISLFISTVVSSILLLISPLPLSASAGPAKVKDRPSPVDVVPHLGSDIITDQPCDTPQSVVVG